MCLRWFRVVVLYLRDWVSPSINISPCEVKINEQKTQNIIIYYCSCSVLWNTQVSSNRIQKLKQAMYLYKVWLKEPAIMLCVEQEMKNYNQLQILKKVHTAPSVKATVTISATGLKERDTNSSSCEEQGEIFDCNNAWMMSNAPMVSNAPINCRNIPTSLDDLVVQK